MSAEPIARIDELTRLFVRAKLNAETAARSLEEITALLKEEMRSSRTNSIDVRLGERRYHLSYRQRITYDFDLDRLKERLHPEVWRRVATTRTTVSKVALEKELTAGQIRPEDVGDIVHEREPVSWVDMREADEQARGDGAPAQA